jgi:hypothetical protein
VRKSTAAGTTDGVGSTVAASGASTGGFGKFPMHGIGIMTPGATSIAAHVWDAVCAFCRKALMSEGVGSVHTVCALALEATLRIATAKTDALAFMLVGRAGFTLRA